ncbi:MAG: hypothetical protein QOE79_2848 [Sphingomonadales bacterium]|jgi:hypothetical protein|nr:hypothetical protein [Sphingomonadales bacterium]MEA3049215.1 hypothetical protein [Sphingomonadales bacterium]
MHRLLVLLLVAAPTPRVDLFPEDYPRVPGEHGLWIGSLHLCGADAARTTLGKDLAGWDILTLTFAPSIQPRLERETTRLLNQPMRIRVDGITVAMPYVDEPIRGTELAMSGSRRDVIETIERAAAAPC